MPTFAVNSLLGRWSSRLRFGNESSWPANMSWLKQPQHARDGSVEAALVAFASMEPDFVLDHMQTHRGGLTDEEAAARRAIKGPNVLPTHTAPSWVVTLLKAIPNPFNVLLICLAILTASIPPGDWVRTACCKSSPLILS